MIEWPLWGAIAVVAVTAAVFIVGVRSLPVAVLAVLARNLVSLTKELVERPRPSPDVVDVEQLLSSFSFPSGHAYNVIILYGLIFYLATVYLPVRWLRLAVQALCLYPIVGTGLERVYAGYHWPSDVLGGYLLGELVLTALILAGEWLLKPRHIGRTTPRPS